MLIYSVYEANMVGLMKKLIFVLVAVILAEIVYFAYLSFNPSSFEPEPSYTVTTDLDQPPTVTSNIPVPTNDDDPSFVDTFYRAINPNMAVDPKVIYTMIFYKKGVTQSSVINNTHEGVITDINHTRQAAFYNYYNAETTIRLVSLND